MPLLYLLWKAPRRRSGQPGRGAFPVSFPALVCQGAFWPFFGSSRLGNRAFGPGLFFPIPTFLWLQEANQGALDAVVLDELNLDMQMTTRPPPPGWAQSPGIVPERQRPGRKGVVLLRGRVTPSSWATSSKGAAPECARSGSPPAPPPELLPPPFLLRQNPPPAAPAGRSP